MASLTSTACSVLARSPALWFADGNVVLEADGTAFKVFGGILAAHSDLLKIHPPPSALSVSVAESGSFCDGCPLVSLPEDISSFELETFLAALHLFDYYPASIAPSFDRLAATIRLSALWHAPSLRTRALADLQAFLPRTLERFDLLVALSHTFSPPAVEQCISLVPIALAARARILLPVAFYLCCQAGVQTLLDGVTLPCPFSASTADEDEEDKDASVVVALSWDDTRTALLGWQRLQTLRRTHTFGFLLSPSPDDCKRPRECTDARLRAIKNMDAPAFDALGASGSLCEATSAALAVIPHGTWSRLGMCDICTCAAEEEHRIGREGVWKMLPGVFGFPSWEVLESEAGE